MHEIHVPARDVARLVAIATPDDADTFASLAAQAREALAGRTVWNINSTANGGGVAEMLRTLLGYGRTLGIDARWLVIDAPRAFYTLTKRIHHGLHGSRGDSGGLGDAERRVYEDTLSAEAAEALAVVRHGDIVLCHDPQTAGLIAPLQAAGAMVLWRCHVGDDTHGPVVDHAWEWLRRYLESADAAIVSRATYAPAWLTPGRVHVVRPSIDPFSPKNQDLDADVVESILTRTGLIAGDAAPIPTFLRADNSPARVDRMADVIRTGPPPPPDVDLVVQISRWDPLKDMAGVMAAFADVIGTHGDHAQLMLVGPNVSSVTDDPEGADVLNAVHQQWRELPHAARARVTLACLPMTDVDENAAIVNALQRHARVVVQKSVHEGFGLTVAEAMWKSRPVIASAVGGLQDQITDGIDGILLADPTDLGACGSAMLRLLDDRGLACRLGTAAHERVRTQSLATRHLRELAGVILATIGADTAPRHPADPEPVAPDGIAVPRPPARIGVPPAAGARAV